jgi:hypothetical protein
VASLGWMRTCVEVSGDHGWFLPALCWVGIGMESLCCKTVGNLDRYPLEVMDVGLFLEWTCI